jgi:hypothetical protein
MRALEISMRRLLATMKALKQMLSLVMMLCILAVGAFAQQGRGGEKQQQKEEQRVRVEEKRGPPPDNRQQNDNNRGGNQKGRP